MYNVPISLFLRFIINIHATTIYCYLFTSMTGDHIIYLTSSGSRDLFQENNPAKFINKLSSPIILDSNTEYEVGLISILYPDQYYAVVANDPAYNIEIIAVKDMGVRVQSELVMKIPKNILAGDIKTIIEIINELFLGYVQSFSRSYFPYLFSENEGVFRWNEDERNIEIIRKHGDLREIAAGRFVDISLRFKSGLATIFGFKNDHLYNIYNVHGIVENHKSSFPPSPRCGVDYIYLYTDVIQPTNFGGQLVNILDCFTLQNGGNKGIHNCIYKPLNTSFIDQISIFITDQKGRSIQFAEGSTLTCALHIRPK